jgi:hypothetical protein
MQDPERFPEWIVTTAFYKAVQVVEAVFANHGQHGHDHNKRLELLKTPRYAILFRDYRPLWTASSVARYLYDNDARVEYSKFSDFLPATKVIDKIVKRRLRTLEQHAVGMLSDSARSALSRIPS